MTAATQTGPETGPDADLEGASPSHAFRWLVSRVGTRVAAAAWWAVIAFFVLLVVDLWIGLAGSPTAANGLLTLGITAVIALPIGHELTHARRMGRMLVRGT